MIITFYQLSVFFLIFSRFSGMILIAPFFTLKSIFSLGKVGLTFWISSLVMFVVPLPQELPNNMMSYMFAVLIELAVGLIIGFTANMIMTAIEFAGTLMDTQAGLSSASVLDPTSGKNAALLELFMKYISILLFLLMNGHHMVLSAVFESFSIIPIGKAVDFTRGAEFIVTMGKELFLIGLRIASPIILVIFIVDFSFGILNKVAEQINVFQLGFQVKPSVSIIVFLGVSPGIGLLIMRILEMVMEYMVRLLGYFTT